MPELKSDYIGLGAVKVELTQAQIDELAATAKTYRQIEAEYGEEVAINVGIARDPDAFEVTDEMFALARPMREVDPEFIEWWQRNKNNMPPAKEWAHLPIDFDILDHFRKDGPGWHKRLNDTLRQAVFGTEAA